MSYKEYPYLDPSIRAEMRTYYMKTGIRPRPIKTEEAFVEEYGVPTGLPTGSKIIGVTETPEGVQIQYKPPVETPSPQPPTPSPEMFPMTVEQFEKFLGIGTEKTGYIPLPKAEVVIVGAKFSPTEGWQIEYIPKEYLPAWKRAQKGEKEPPKDLLEWLGTGVGGLKSVAVERLSGGVITGGRPSPIEIITGKPSEPKTLVALKQIHTTQEWLRRAPLPPIVSVKPSEGVKLEHPLEPAAKASEVAKFPVGIVAEIESFAYPQVPSLSGAIFETVTSPIPETQLGPFQIGGGQPTAQSLEEYWEIMGPWGTAGGLLGLYLMGKAFGAVMGEAWGGIKRGGKWVGKKVGIVVHKPLVPPPIGEIPSWMSPEEWYEFYVQTTRATSRPVPVRVYGKAPWRVITKHEPPTAFEQIAKMVEAGKFPKMGGLSGAQLLFETEPELANIVLRRLTPHTILKGVVIEPAKRAWLPTMMGISVSVFAKGVSRSIVGVVPKPKRLKKVRQPSVSDELLKPWSEVVPWLGQPAREKTAVALKPVALQLLKTSQVAKQILQLPQKPPPQQTRGIPRPPRRRQKPRKGKRKRKKGRKTKIGQYEILYPVATASEASKYIMSGLKSGKSKKRKK